MSTYSVDANVTGSLKTAFGQLPSVSWNNNNTALVQGWQALNVSNFTATSAIPTTSGITWSGTNITIPYFGIYAITINARINTSGCFVQMVLNTGIVGNGAAG